MQREHRSKSNHVTLVRQWKALCLLHGEMWSVSRLALYLRTSKSNVERDLKTLMAAGFPVESHRSNRHQQTQLWTLSYPVMYT